MSSSVGANHSLVSDVLNVRANVLCRFSGSFHLVLQFFNVTIILRQRGANSVLHEARGWSQAGWVESGQEVESGQGAESGT